MPELTITWHGIQDQRTCEKCRNLISSQASWKFNTEKDPFPDVLSHPQYGIIWDCQLDVSQAHGSSQHTCRCRPTWQMTDVDLKQPISAVKTRIETLKHKLEKRQL